MKLPEEMPEKLFCSIINNETVKDRVFNGPSIPARTIYSLIINYFNNLPVDWRPVSEKPEKDSDVWLLDENDIHNGIYYKGKFFIAVGDYIEITPAKWCYVESKKPEPPKE